MIYRAEILGKVPAGLTWNDVYATILQVLTDETKVIGISKCRVPKGQVSVIATIEATDSAAALRMFREAGRSVYNFSFDVIGPKSV